MGPEKSASASGGSGLPQLTVDRGEELFEGTGGKSLAGIIGRQLAARRWFGGKARKIRQVEIADAVPLPSAQGAAGLDPVILLVQVKYAEGETETYLLPLAAADEADPLDASTASAVAAVDGALARVSIGGRVVLLVDALKDRSFCALLLSAIAARRSFPGKFGKIHAWPAGPFDSIRDDGAPRLEPTLMDREQSNTSIRFGDRFILKVLRRVETGVSLELEISRYLTERASFSHTPSLAGAIEYRRDGKEPATLAVLQKFVPNRGDAWRYCLEALGNFIGSALSKRASAPPVRPRPFLEFLGEGALPGRSAVEHGSFQSANLLGRRTAELHRALAGGSGDPSFAPEPFEVPRRREIHDGMIGQADRSFRLLRDKLDVLRGPAGEAARSVLREEGAIRERYRSILDGEASLLLIRCHGDYHLGQALWTGEDFFIIDFEGEPARPLSERRRKRPALQDVAGMLRSFHYASQSAIQGQASGLSISEADLPLAESWARLWYLCAATSFLRGYLTEAAGAPFLPAREKETQALLDCFLLDKAVYEVAYELNNRPGWVRIPLQGILELLGTPPPEAV